MERRIGSLLAVMVLFVWAACGGSDPDEELSPGGTGGSEGEEELHGSLEISFSGLPEGLVGRAVVSGLLFEEEVEGDTLLEGLEPGRYIVSAAELEHDGFLHVPKLHHTEIDVIEDEVAEVLVEYDTEEMLPFLLHSDGAVVPLHGSGQIEVSITRNEGFSERVEISLMGVPQGIAVARGAIGATETSTTLSLISNGTLREMGTRTITIVGQAGPERVERTTTLRVDPMVTNLDDAGEGSLRYYLNLASELVDVEGGPATITFDPELQGNIELSSPLQLSGETIVHGPAFETAPRVALHGGGARQLMFVMAEAEVEIHNLAFVGGMAAEGGAINNLGALRLRGARFEGNEANMRAGAIVNHGSLEAAESAFVSNKASAGSGGAILNVGQAEFDDVLFEDNYALEGGAIATGLEPPTGGTPPTLVLGSASFIGNEAEERGGAILAAHGHVEVGAEGVFAGNVAGGSGGAILILEAATASLDSVSFDGNSAEGTGGAIHVQGSGGSEESLRAIRSVFAGSEAKDSGGAIYATEAKVLILDSRFEKNQSHEDGGAIALHDDGSGTIANTYFEGNDATAGGAIHTTVPLDVRTSTLLDNEAAQPGGGIWTDAKTLVLNSTLVENKSRSTGGGAIFVSESGDLTVWHSTLSKNEGTTGGGIRNEGTARIGRSIFWDNAVTGGGGVDIITPATSTEASASSAGYNLFMNLTASQLEAADTDRVNDHPLLEPLAENLGITPTMALRGTSPAVDLIPANDCVDHEGAALEIDQRGAPRPVGDGCDAGAYELQLE